MSKIVCIYPHEHRVSDSMSSVFPFPAYTHEYFDYLQAHHSRGCEYKNYGICRCRQLPRPPKYRVYAKNGLGSFYCGCARVHGIHGYPETEIMVRQISKRIKELIGYGEKVACKMFEAKKDVVAVESYVKWILNILAPTGDVLVLALIYLGRICKVVTKRTFFRLLLAAILVGVKYYGDVSGLVGGMFGYMVEELHSSGAAIARMERTFLRLIDYRLFVSSYEFYHTRALYIDIDYVEIDGDAWKPKDLDEEEAEHFTKYVGVEEDESKYYIRASEDEVRGRMEELAREHDETEAYLNEIERKG